MSIIKQIKRIVLVSMLLSTALLLSACTHDMQQLQAGQANFQSGNYHQAFLLLKPLAQKGNADAQYAVGYMYYYGKGVTQDPYLARKWMRKAAAQGQPLAIQALNRTERQASVGQRAMFSVPTTQGGYTAPRSSSPAGPNSASRTPLPNFPD